MVQLIRKYLLYIGFISLQGGNSHLMVLQIVIHDLVVALNEIMEVYLAIIVNI
jgi:hypothetical protein